MDLITLLIGVAVTAVFGVIAVAVTKFGFGGESEYEQQIARQKEILLDDTKGKAADKKKNKAEKKKKAVKAKGELTGQTSGSDLEPDNVKDVTDHPVQSEPAPEIEELPPHIEYDPDPVIIQPDVHAPPAKSSKKGKKLGPSKSILHNRDEVPVVRSEDAAVAETVFPETATPKDDLELKHAKAKKSGKKDKQKQVQEPQPVVEEIVPVTAVKVEAAAPAAPPQQVVEEMIVAKAEAPVSSAPSQPSKKSKSRAGGKPISDLSEIIRIVLEAPLSKDQMQTLVENVLSRMESEDSWTTKGAKPDPVAVLRKQLEETQAALDEEKSNTYSAQCKIKEVTAKLAASEKQSTGYVSQLRETERRMQQSHDEHKKEVQALRSGGYQDKQKVEQQIEIISQLSEENQRLKQSVANTDEVAQMQNQIRSLTQEKQAAAIKTADAEKLIEQSKHELARSKENNKTLEQEKQVLKKRCDELGQKLAQTQNSVTQAQTKAAEAERDLKNAREHMATLQAAPKQNGLPDEAIDELEQKINGLEQLINDKEKQMEGLQQQLKAANSAQQDINALKQKSADSENRVQTSQAEVQKLQDANKDLQSQVTESKASLDSKDETISQLEKSLKEEEQKVAKLTNEKAELHSTINGGHNGVSVDVHEHEQKVSSLEGLVHDKDDEIANLRKQLNAARTNQNDLNLLKQKSIDEAKQRDDLQIQVDDFQTQVQKLKDKNNDLQEKCDSLISLTSEVSSLRREVNEAKVNLDSKDKTISQLERSLKEEEQKVAATVSECRGIIEGEFSGKIKEMSDEHEALIKQLSDDLDAQTQLLNSVESSRNDLLIVVDTLKGNNNESEQEVEKLKKQVTGLHQDKTRLEAQVRELNTQTMSSTPAIADHSSSQTNLYRNALNKVETMLDSLAEKVENEHKKISMTLSSKDEQLSAAQERLDAALKQLDNSSKKASADSAKVKDLTRQLETSNQKVVALEKAVAEGGSAVRQELTKVENALKDEQLKSRQLAQHLAAAMAASGDADESGTCV